jgi:phosphoglucosamine mutase
MAIAALHMLEQRTLKQNTLVTTIMSNAGLETAIKAAGGCVIRTPVGDKHVIEEMLRGGYNFGGEQSGHLIFGDHCTTGDGLIAALQILQTMKMKNQPLSRLARCWTRFPQIVSNVRVREKRPLDQLDGVAQLVAQAEAEVQATGGRVLLRYSGTEPKARLMMEGQDSATLERWSKLICDAIKNQIGA